MRCTWSGSIDKSGLNFGRKKIGCNSVGACFSEVQGMSENVFPKSEGHIQIFIGYFSTTYNGICNSQDLSLKRNSPSKKGCVLHSKEMSSILGLNKILCVLVFFLILIVKNN